MMRSASRNSTPWARKVSLLLLVAAACAAEPSQASAAARTSNPVPDALAPARLARPVQVPAVAKPHAAAPAAHRAAGHASPGLAPAEALAKLMAGNARYVSGKPFHPNQNSARRKSLSAGQKPHTIVVCCSDSRVPPELLFDQGLGDLFVVRVAGHVVDEAALGSIEYAIEHLGTRAILVLGHSGCGAVKATVSAHQKGSYPEGHVWRVASLILPAVGDAKKCKGDLVANTVVAHVRRTAAALRASRPVLASRAASGAVAICGAVYDLNTGRVSRLF